MNVKKSFTIFKILSFLWLVTTVVLTTLFAQYWLVYAAFGGLALAVCSLYFAKLSYRTNGNILTISSGILFRKERFVPLEKVLIKTKLCLGRECLLTILTFSGGRVIVFADF